MTGRPPVVDRTLPERLLGEAEGWQETWPAGFALLREAADALEALESDVRDWRRAAELAAADAARLRGRPPTDAEVRELP